MKQSNKECAAATRRSEGTCRPSRCSPVSSLSRSSCSRCDRALAASCSSSSAHREDASWRSRSSSSSRAAGGKKGGKARRSMMCVVWTAHIVDADQSGEKQRRAQDNISPKQPTRTAGKCVDLTKNKDKQARKPHSGD